MALHATRAGALILLAGLLPAGCTDARSGGADTDAPIEVADQSPEDLRYLQWIRDHHSGLAEVIHAVEVQGRAAGRQVEALDLSYDLELDQARSLLRTRFSDTLPPRPSREALAWLDSLRFLPPERLDESLRRLAVVHHEEVIRATGEYLRHGTSPAVRRLAEEIRARKTEELQALQGDPRP